MDDHKCVCHKSFKCLSSLYRHKNKCSEALAERQNKFLVTSLDSGVGYSYCLNEACEYRSKYIEELRVHLEKMHSFPIHREVLKFESYSDFEDWKTEYETSTTATYGKSQMRRTEVGKIEYFYCNRSGRYRQTGDPRKRRLKRQGSVKSGRNCTSAIKAKYFDETQTVEAHICHSHYGHDMELNHCRLPNKTKKELAVQLISGVTVETILEKTQQFSPGDEKLERVHLINRRDLLNIKKSYGISKIIRKGSEDVNFEISIQENLKQIRLYKRQGDLTVWHPNNSSYNSFGKNDFALVIMSDFQMSLLKRFGGNIICMDLIKKCYFNFITITVIDDFGESISVAWILYNKMEEMRLKDCLISIRNAVGVITPKTFMSDKLEIYYSTWRSVFTQGVEPKQLFCIWNVQNDWKTNLNKMKNQKIARDIYKALHLLLYQTETVNFEILLAKVLDDLNCTDQADGFDKYFEEWVEYKKQWACCYRLEEEINVEAFNEKLKTFNFEGEEIKRVDKYLLNLFEFANMNEEKIKTKLRDRKNEIVKNHSKATELQVSLVQETAINKWNVQYSDNEINELEYQSKENCVEQILLKCTKNCTVRCEDCQICHHMFTCDCIYSSAEGILCEHIHLVQMFKKDPSSAKDCTDNVVIDESADEQIWIVNFEETSNNYAIDQSVILDILQNTVSSNEQALETSLSNNGSLQISSNIPTSKSLSNVGILHNELNVVTLKEKSKPVTLKEKSKPVKLKEKSNVTLHGESTVVTLKNDLNVVTLQNESNLKIVQCPAFIEKLQCFPNVQRLENVVTLPTLNVEMLANAETLENAETSNEETVRSQTLMQATSLFENLKSCKNMEIIEKVQSEIIKLNAILDASNFNPLDHCYATT